MNANNCQLFDNQASDRSLTPFDSSAQPREWQEENNRLLFGSRSSKGKKKQHDPKRKANKPQRRRQTLNPKNLNSVLLLDRQLNQHAQAKPSQDLPAPEERAGEDERLWLEVSQLVTERLKEIEAEERVQSQQESANESQRSKKPNVPR